MTTTASGLVERAVRAARTQRAADPDGFHRRHDTPHTWDRWARRARVAREIAAALDTPVDAVLVTDDPHRTYPTRTGPVPGDLITVTDPLTAHPWRFIPDNATPGQSWWLLDRCPGCATEVPVARVATLADLGDHLDPNRPGGANRKSAERPTECACSPSSPGEAAVRGVARNATVR